LKFLRKAIFLAGFTVAVLIAQSAGATGDMKIRTLDGQNAMLSEYFEPGKWTLVMIWTTYCGVCAQQFPLISAFHSKHRDSDLKVVGISLDGFRYADQVRAYMTQRAPAFDSLIGEVAEIAPSFRETTGEAFNGTPTYLLFDPKGQISGQKAGPIETEEIERFIRDNPS
jgi:thiol-disulfide isomerase/thioredoxin